MVAGQCIAELFGRETDDALVGGMLLAALVAAQSGDPDG